MMLSRLWVEMSGDIDENKREERQLGQRSKKNKKRENWEGRKSESCKKRKGPHIIRT